MSQTAQTVQTLKDRPALVYSAVLVLGVVLLFVSWLLFVFGMIEYIVLDFKQGFNNAVVELYQGINRPTGRMWQEDLDGMPLSLILYAISSVFFFLLGGFCAVWGTRRLFRLRKQQIAVLKATQPLKQDNA